MNEKMLKKVKALLTNSLNTDERAPSYECVNQDRGFRGNVQPSGVVEDNPEDFQLSNNHTLMLIKLSRQLSETELGALHETLYNYLTSNFKKQLAEATTLYFVHTGRIKELLDQLSKTLGTDGGNSAEFHCMAALARAMAYRPDLFSEANAEMILDWCDAYYNPDSKLGRGRREHPILYRQTDSYFEVVKNKANEIFTRHFARQIDNSFNPELNIDEEKVVEVIGLLGFPLDLSEQLRHIDELLSSANEPKKYRDAMSAIRVFTERLYEQIAKEIEPTTSINGKDSDKASKFFKENKLISHDMAELISAHRHFLSNDGAHRIKSRREDARIGKNMTIELSLYLLTRLREIKNV